jgi:hypothetical protein
LDDLTAIYLASYDTPRPTRARRYQQKRPSRQQTPQNRRKFSLYAHHGNRYNSKLNKKKRLKKKHNQMLKFYTNYYSKLLNNWPHSSHSTGYQNHHNAFHHPKPSYSHHYQPEHHSLFHNPGHAHYEEASSFASLPKPPPVASIAVDLSLKPYRQEYSGFHSEGHHELPSYSRPIKYKHREKYPKYASMEEYRPDEDSSYEKQAKSLAYLVYRHKKKYGKQASKKGWEDDGTESLLSGLMGNADKSEESYSRRREVGGTKEDGEHTVIFYVPSQGASPSLGVPQKAGQGVVSDSIWKTVASLTGLQQQNSNVQGGSGGVYALAPPPTQAPPPKPFWAVVQDTGAVSHVSGAQPGAVPQLPYYPGAQSGQQQQFVMVEANPRRPASSGWAGPNNYQPSYAPVPMREEPTSSRIEMDSTGRGRGEESGETIDLVVSGEDDDAPVKSSRRRKKAKTIYLRRGRGKGKSKGKIITLRL